MSYCRFAWDGSDVYVIPVQGGIECCACKLNDKNFQVVTPEEMIAHLALHRRAGQFVPFHAIDRLWDEIPGADKPAHPEPVELTLSSLRVERAILEAKIRDLEQQEQK